LQISIGPIQEFIAAARRTRDLWFGSTLLSEISKAAAKAVEDAGGHLIFPNSDDLGRDLTPNSDFNVANVILAEVENASHAKNVSDAAKEAAEKRWIDFADEAYDTLRGRIDEEAWTYQKNGVIEFYSAWRPFKDDLSDYRQARQSVARLLAARKNLRDFDPWKGKEGVPKSSLDGLRESVLRERRGAINIRGARVKTGEILDIVGCVKRAAGKRISFPSVTRIAIDPWIRGFCEKERLTSLLQYAGKNPGELSSCCKELAELGVLSPVKRDEYSTFPYEGTALLPQRYSALAEEANENDKQTVEAITKDMRKLMTELHRIHTPMDPYLAVLAADGDKMGKAISSLSNPDRHREFSQSLSKFAGEARDIVKRHYGSCIYTGGDDVLAFLPMDTALDCARSLYDAFGALWKTGWEEFKKGDAQSPTLSVGIAVGHALEDMETLLEFGRKAERLAKQDVYGSHGERNGLAVTVRARGNSEISIREQWGAYRDPLAGEQPLADLSLEQRLLFWARHFAERRIPTKFPYELRNSAAFYEHWGQNRNLDGAMQMDVLRIFNRKDLNFENDQKSRIEDYIKSAIRGSHRSIERLADQLLAAQWIGYARAAAGGRHD
jgi:CRISPR-associated protein Cmr2